MNYKINWRLIWNWVNKFLMNLFPIVLNTIWALSKNNQKMMRVMKMHLKRIMMKTISQMKKKIKIKR